MVLHAPIRLSRNPLSFTQHDCVFARKIQMVQKIK